MSQLKPVWQNKWETIKTMELPGHNEELSHHPGALSNELLHQFRSRHADEGTLCVVSHGPGQ